MRNRIKLVICAGGTGGHIYPGIAVAQKIKNDAPGSEIVFFSSGKKIEKEIFSFYGIKPVIITSTGLNKGKGVFGSLLSIGLSVTAVYNSLAQLKKIKPIAVLCMGGYLTLPVVLSSWLLKIPVILHEQNALPGRANRMSRYFAKKIAVTFEESLKYFGNKAVVCGNPVREEILSADKDVSKKALNISEKMKIALVTGGSQGAASINTAVVEMLPLINDPDIFVIHICGTQDHSRIQGKTKGFNNYRLIPYLDDMSGVLSASDLVISRAGATMLSEIAALGKPSVLVPYPYASQRHQDANARIFAEKGAAKIIDNSSLSGRLMSDIIKELLNEREKLQKMSSAARALSKNDAAAKIEDLVYETV